MNPDPEYIDIGNRFTLHSPGEVKPKSGVVVELLDADGDETAKAVEACVAIVELDEGGYLTVALSEIAKVNMQ